MFLIYADALFLLLSPEMAAEMRLTTSRAATGSFVPGPKMAEAPALNRKS